MAGEAVQRDQDVIAVLGIDQIRNRMAHHRMAQPVLQRQNWRSCHVVLRQLDLAVKDGDQVLAFQFLRVAVGTMALETELVGRTDPQKMIVVVAMRFVADGTALLEGRLVNVMFLALLGLIGMAAEAD